MRTKERKKEKPLPKDDYSSSLNWYHPPRCTSGTDVYIQMNLREVNKAFSFNVKKNSQEFLVCWFFNLTAIQKHRKTLFCVLDKRRGSSDRPFDFFLILLFHRRTILRITWPHNLTFLSHLTILRFLYFLYTWLRDFTRWLNCTILNIFRTAYICILRRYTVRGLTMHS